MSTINKTFLRVLLAIACCIALAFSLLPQAEAAMRADVVTGKVTLNGQVIDNKNAKYPLLTYSNITYFPMTYQLSRFMGVETDWNNAAKSLNITAGGAQSAYVAETGKAQRGSVAVTPASYKISVNGAQINNKEEKYPIFNYNGITYFPLTWAYAVDSFGWSYQWDAENGLRIDTTSAPARVPTDPEHRQRRARQGAHDPQQQIRHGRQIPRHARRRRQEDELRRRARRQQHTGCHHREIYCRAVPVL